MASSTSGRWGYRKVPRGALGRCYEADGTHRPRLVAKANKKYNAPELSSATPPIESPKYLLRRSARDRTLSVMQVDVTRAYSYVDVLRDMYMRLPAEDQESDEYNVREALQCDVRGPRCGSELAADVFRDCSGV